MDSTGWDEVRQGCTVCSAAFGQGVAEQRAAASMLGYLIGLPGRMDLISEDDWARICAVSVPVALFAFGAGLLVAVLTAPVGVSGAVFLLPIQLDLLRVPSPAVTPTNLLFNVVATPGALLRYKRTGRLGGTLPRQLLAGTLPGVVIGTLMRVYLAPGDRIFRLLAAGVLLPLGLWLCLRRPEQPVHPRDLRTSTITVSGSSSGSSAASTASAAAPCSARSSSAQVCPSSLSPPPR